MLANGIIPQLTIVEEAIMGEVAKILTQELPKGMRLPLDVVKRCIQPYFCGEGKRTPRGQYGFVVKEIQCFFIDNEWFSGNMPLRCEIEYFRHKEPAVTKMFKLLRMAPEIPERVLCHLMRVTRDINNYRWMYGMPHTIFLPERPDGIRCAFPKFISAFLRKERNAAYWKKIKGK